MTLTATTVRVSYDGDDSTIAFPITFVFWGNDDLDVVLRDSAGVETAWTRGTQYTLTGGSGATGTLTVETAPTDYTPATGETLVIASALANTQPTEIPLGGALSSASLEQQLDQTVRQGQQRDEQLGRSVRFPITDAAALSAELPASSARASKAFHFDSGGEPTMVEPTDASGTSVTATGSTTSRLLAERFAEIINVKDYGAVGDGATNDTVAITAAWDAAVATNLRQTAFGTEWTDAVFQLAVLYFPPGDYVFNGPALDVPQNTSVRVFGAGRRQVRVRLAAGIYMFDLSQFIYECEMRDFSIVGGKGLFRHSRTAENTGNYFTFENIDLLNYTECGIGSLSSNVPQWNVRSCQFYGTDTSIGLLVPDKSASGEIVHNIFSRNKYHMKVSLDNSFHTIGPNNTYLRAAGTIAADVWLVGRSTDVANSGDGLTFLKERFSNEGMAAGDIRVLIAEEDTGSGSDLMDRSHATTDAGGFFAMQIKFDGCGFGGVGAPGDATNKGVVFSYLSRTQIDLIDPSIQGGWFPWWLEFASGVTPFASQNINISRVTNPMQRLEPNLPQPCNVPGFVTYTAYDGGYSGHLDQADLEPGGDYNYEDVLATADPNSWTLSAGGGSAPTKSSQTDVLGGSLATEITFLDELGNLQNGLTETNMVAGEKCWIGLDVKKAATVPMLRLRIDIGESGGAAIRQRIVEVTDDWRRIRLPWTVNATPTTLVISLKATGIFDSGVEEKVLIGRPAVYRGNSPQHHRHLATAGSRAGFWDGPHITLGSLHVWRDATEALRRKDGAPTSDTDGTLV